MAAVFHVSATGSDGNSGSAASPFRQIRRALMSAVPGDTILVGDGGYLGFDLAGKIGGASSVLTIRALGQGANVLPTSDRSDNRDTIHVSSSAWVVIEGLRAFNGNRASVRVNASHHVTIRNGVFGDNATWGIFTNHSDDLLLEGNVCFGSVAEHGIYVSNSGDRPVVRGNRSYGNRGAGIQLNADASQGGDGLITGAVIENNILSGNGAGGGGAINLDGVQDSIVRNNLLYDNHASGITNFQIDGAAGPRGMRILNNTIDQAADGRWAVLISETTGVNVVRNNILYNRHSFRGGLLFGDAADAAATDSDYNVMDWISTDNGASRISLAQWKTLGHDANSLSATLASLFVSPASADYHLSPGSPARDRGVALVDVPQDLEGRARPAGIAFDIGCYEFFAATGTSFFTVAPCRIADTRNPAGPFGGPALAANTERSFTAAGRCGISATAAALSINVTVTQPSAAGNLRLFPGGMAAPLASAVNYSAGQTRANNAVAGLSAGGSLTVRCDQPAGMVHVILDVNGYFE